MKQALMHNQSDDRMITLNDEEEESPQIDKLGNERESCASKKISEAEKRQNMISHSPMLNSVGGEEEVGTNEDMSIIFHVGHP